MIHENPQLQKGALDTALHPVAEIAYVVYAEFFQVDGKS
jgi:hypothetical protein